MNTHSKSLVPGRLYLPGCAVAAGLLALSFPLKAGAEGAVPSPQSAPESAARMTLRVGNTACFPLDAGETYALESGAGLVTVEADSQSLAVKAVEPGLVRLRLTEANGTTHITVMDLSAVATMLTAPMSTVVNQVNADLPGSAAVPAGSSLPALVPAPSAPVPAPETMTPYRAPNISPALPAPTGGATAVSYRTQNSIPGNIGGAARQAVPVTQGLARLLSFPSNILSVFFSDPTVMDARAINARTIAVTGLGPGTSTLAVFTSRYPGDAIGISNIYRIEVTPSSGNAAPAAPDMRDPDQLRDAIVAALDDPRIHVLVFRQPDGSLAVRLTGSVRDNAEVKGIVDTVGIYSTKVISEIYVDTNSPTIDAVLQGGYAPELGDADLQGTLRRLTGNDTIELVPLPNSTLAFKAEVSSQDEAGELLRLLPTLNREIVPFIVIHGVDNDKNPAFGTVVPNLTGEDRQLTSRLQQATGIYTVYALRASSNGIAIYGNVANRGEYDRVRRYSLALAQLSTPTATAPASQGGQTERPTGTEGALPAYDPAGGYQNVLGVQMFVHILGGASIRKVSVQTDVVEINHTAMTNLGINYGSQQTTAETDTAATTTSPATVTRTLSPSITPGVVDIGNGFLGVSGTNGFQASTSSVFTPIDPLRATINALVTKGDARILSSPNLTAVEGMSAQITIGGDRPIPTSTATQGAVGEGVEFRNYGVILTMRPTVSDDNTIILQIRADVTALDTSTAITIGGASIPGETVRSVNTTLTVRAGDVIVMGGLITDNKSYNVNKFPILGDIPILGPLFNSKSFQDNKTELAIFMSPHIESLDVSDETQAELDRAPSFPALPGNDGPNTAAILNLQSH